MKKAFALLLAALLIFGTMNVATVNAAGDVVFSVSTRDANPGETVDLTVSLSNNSGICGMVLSVDYDSSKLEWINVTKGSLDGVWDVAVGTTIDFVATENAVGNATVATLAFKVKDGASGFANVTVTPSKLFSYDEEYDEQNVGYSVSAGGVNIPEPEPEPEPESEPKPEPAPAEEQAKEIAFVVATKEAKRGETVDVEISIVNNPGVCGMEIGVVYDDSKLEWTNVSQGSMDGVWDVAVGETIDFGSLENIKGNVVISTLTFKVKNDASGFASVSVVPNKLFGYDSNHDEQPVGHSVTAGGISIPEAGHEHTWSTVTYTWSTDNSTVTATRKCQDDTSHVETETVNTTVTTAENGNKTITATFANTAFETQRKLEASAASETPTPGETPTAGSKEGETPTAGSKEGETPTAGSKEGETPTAGSEPAAETSTEDQKTEEEPAEQPTEPAATSSNNDNNTTKTGNRINVGLWIVLACVAVAIILLVAKKANVTKK